LTSTRSSQAPDGAQSRVAVAETLFSKGKVGTCRDLPPKVELFDAAQAANQVLAIEDSIKRYSHALEQWRTSTCFKFVANYFLSLSLLKVANVVQNGSRAHAIGGRHG
jgi:hypothetical protein